MAKKKLPLLSDLRKILVESVFDPRKPGPMAPIVEQNDARYYVMRAKEMISEAELSLGIGPTYSDHQMSQYHLKISQAIGLLGLARLIRNQKD